MCIEKVPLTSNDEPTEAYVKKMKDYFSQEDVLKRSQSGDLHKSNLGYIDTCQGMGEAAEEAISGVRNLVDELFVEHQRGNT